MKEVWVCQWETIPGDGEHVQQVATLAEAKLAMRQKISQSIDLKAYLADLEPQVAQFLGNYLSNPAFPESERDVPQSYEEPEHGELWLNTKWIQWDYPYDAYPRINTNLVLDDAGREDYTFDFWYEYPEEATGNGVNGLSIRIWPCTEYGTSAYPLMVLFALRETPKTQGQIIRTILEVWDTVIDRKAVGRHLQLLRDLGLPVQHGPAGYYYGGEAQSAKTGVKFGPSAYPLMIYKVLDNTPKTQSAIIQQIQETYGTKIDRKAVSRHLELLEAMGVAVQRCKDGYYLSE